MAHPSLARLQFLPKGSSVFRKLLLIVTRLQSFPFLNMEFLGISLFLGVYGLIVKGKSTVLEYVHPCQMATLPMAREGVTMPLSLD